MTFPVTSREVYTQNFIMEAVCQVRFPRLLEIESQVPAKFQRTLLPDFPLLASREQFGISFGQVGGDASTPMPTRTTVYDFRTSDGNVTVALCSEYVSIVMGKYVDWTTLRTYMVKALGAAAECYGIPIFTRLGLRYVNVIPQIAEKWDEVLNPCLVGPLATVDMSSVRAWQSASSFSMGNARQLNMMASLGDAGTPSFVLDLDIFSTSGGVFDVEAVATSFDEMNAQATDAFNWAKGPRLEQALHGAATDV